MELADSVRRFNARWQQFLAALDLDPVNDLIDGYNRYYLLERSAPSVPPASGGRDFGRSSPSRTNNSRHSFRFSRSCHDAPQARVS